MPPRFQRTPMNGEMQNVRSIRPTLHPQISCLQLWKGASKRVRNAHEWHPQICCLQLCNIPSKIPKNMYIYIYIYFTPLKAVAWALACGWLPGPWWARLGFGWSAVCWPWLPCDLSVTRPSLCSGCREFVRPMLPTCFLFRDLNHV